jgi:hypothetical protein
MIIINNNKVPNAIAKDFQKGSFLYDTVGGKLNGIFVVIRMVSDLHLV